MIQHAEAADGEALAVKDGGLTMFRPLERVVVPDIGDLALDGLTLIVGPNSSGKTQLLQDIYHKLAGEPRKLVVADEVRVQLPEYNVLMEALERDGYFRQWEDDGGTMHYRPQTTYLGTGTAVNQIQLNQARTWYQSYPAQVAKDTRRVEFLSHFGRLLVTALFLQNRLSAMNQTGLIDFLVQPPTHDLHALFVNDSARAALLREMQLSFGKSVWPDMTRGNALCLKVADGELPSLEDRTSFVKMAEYRSIESEGDGLKSYVAICVALLLGRRPICLLDEPEMCLHPPQAYNLGQFIGSVGSSREGATLVASHSSHVLRGVIQTASNVQIVRLTRHEGRFQAHRVPPAALQDAIEKPTVRAENVLDGIFAQAVVVLEADGDRTVYQAVWETLTDEHHLDIR